MELHVRNIETRGANFLRKACVVDDLPLDGPAALHVDGVTNSLHLGGHWYRENGTVEIQAIEGRRRESTTTGWELSRELSCLFFDISSLTVSEESHGLFSYNYTNFNRF